MKTTMKDIFADLVALPTVSDNPEANRQALDYIDAFLRQRGMYIAHHNFNGVLSLVATTQPTKTPRVMLAAHVDVVPAAPRLFKLEERDGKFFGRGTCDMKFAIATYLQFVEDYHDQLSQYDFGIMITTDEEMGGRLGVKALLDEAGYRAQVCVLPDGGDNWALEQAAKGLIWISATASGASAHGSRPWEGESAIEKMLLFLQAMQRELFAEQSNDTNTCNIGTIQGGQAPNQVADVCTADIDIRTLNKDEHARIVGRLRELSDEYDINLAYRLNDSPINVDLSDPLVATYVQAVERATGQQLMTIKSNGGSDARYFAAYDIPTLVGYPTGGGRHSEDEWLEVASFYKFYDVLQAYLQAVSRTDDARHNHIRTAAVA